MDTQQAPDRRDPPTAESAHGPQPVVVRTESIRGRREPVAYDRVKLIFVRGGSAWFFSEFGERPARLGDVVVLAANTLCGAEPEGWLTATTVYLDREYVVDQVFWQHAAMLADRLEAQDLLAACYSEPAQVLRLGEQRVGCVMPWLDELSLLSLDGPTPERFYRMQALLFAVLDVVAPFVQTSGVRRSATQRKGTWPGMSAVRRVVPLRAEAQTAADLMRADPAHRCVACHEHGTGLSGSLPTSWDHLDCQSWDHSARLAGGSLVSSLTARVMSIDAEVVEGGVPGGQRG